MNTYTPVWHKYRPAILRMMVDSGNAPQQYQLSDHEFKILNPRQKGGYAFCMQVARSRAVSGMKDSLIAHDLLEMLKLSPKGSSMISEGAYEFSMTREFVLTITRTDQVETAPIENPETENTETENNITNS